MPRSFLTSGLRMGGPPVCVLLVLLTITTDVRGYTLVASKNPLAVNSSVTLSLSPETTLVSGAWVHKGLIVSWYPGSVDIYKWKDRITFNKTSLELSIRALQVEDSGLFMLQGTKQDKQSIEATVDLKVQEIVTGVTLHINSTSLVELNDTAVFRCSVRAGSSLSYHWLNDSSEVTAGLVQLHNLGSILRIPKVSRYDQGPFRCNVSNDISRNISQSIPLNISYGPSDLIMMVHPEMAAYKTGSNITLSCSAQSKPGATYQWSLNGKSVNQYGPQLQLWSTRQNQTGSYTCLAHNSVTLRFSDVTTMIRIVDPISAVSVSLTGEPPILNDKFNLSCEVTGPVDYIYWRKNDKTISPDNRTVFSMNNKTVTFHRVQHSDNGHYTCEAFNAVSNMTSAPYRVLVNYGPDKPVITGKAVALNGSSVTMNCSASSQPPSVFSWYFNGSKVASGPVYETDPLTLDDDGNYTCVAFNSITDRNSTASKMLTVIDPVTMATVKVLGAQPIENHTFTVTCVAKGSVYSIHWLKGSRHVHPDNRTFLSMDNRNLTFNPVLHSDNGEYQCVASNPLTSKTSDNYTLLVNYGPEKPVITGPEVAMTGHNVTLNCSASSQPPSVFSWYFKGSKVASGPVYETGPLTLDDDGNYTCVAFNNITHRNSKTSKMLTVIDPITMATVKVLGAQPIENHTFTVTCVAKGSVYSIHWLKGSRHVHPDNRTFLSMDNRNVTFNPVLQSDNGEYQCVASNPLTSKTSGNYTLLVNYGPEKPVITGPEVAMTGHNVTLNCSASSQPPSVFSWYFNGSKVASGPVYETGPLTLDDDGNYTCVAFNSITDRNSTASEMLTVITPLTLVSISVDGKLAILNEPFNMTCTMVGKPTSIHWMKDGRDLLPNHRTVFSTGNVTVTFSSVQHSDQGDYTCQATNYANNKTSPEYMLIVNFGPEQPMIDGLAVEETGQRVTLNCSASSQPPSVFSWYFNGSKVASGPVYETGPLTLDDDGNYTCVAFNSITDRNSTASKMLTVVSPITQVHIRSPLKSAVEGQSYTLSCDVTGPADGIYWWKDHRALNADNRTVFSRKNRTVTINPVQRSDVGAYECQAVNAVSNKTSAAYTLVVNYGPEKPVITGPEVAVTGHNVTLTCSASSQPPSVFSWYFNGSKVASGPVYETGPLTLDDDGNYTCVAFNSITDRNSTASEMLTVITPLTSVSISVDGKLAILNEPFNMTCTMVGKPTSIHWMKDGRDLLPNHRTVFSTGNVTVTFSSVQHSDQGDYTCQATNDANNKTSPEYILVVNFGPEQPLIDGLAVEETGQRVTLNCSASSQPPSVFSWYFNGSKVASGPVYETGPLTLDDDGNYTCVAFNSITDRNSTASKMLTVVEAIQSVMVKPNTTPINSDKLALTCDVVGHFISIFWMKNDLMLLNTSVDQNIHLYNNSLHFDPVKVSDDGWYQCAARSLARTHYSPPYQLLVNYGPLSIAISQTISVVSGKDTTVSLKCSADSRPTSKYEWFFQHKPGGNTTLWGTGPVLAVMGTIEQSGNYTCKATNPLTKIALSTIQKLTFSAGTSVLPLQTKGGLMLMLLVTLSLSVLNNQLLY